MARPGRLMSITKAVAVSIQAESPVFSFGGLLLFYLLLYPALGGGAVF